LCRAAEKGALDVKCVDELPAAKDTAITIANTSAETSSEGSESAAPPSPVAKEGAKPPGVFRGMFKSVQQSAIWRTLNYGMDYDIHKVCLQAHSADEPMTTFVTCPEKAQHVRHSQQRRPKRRGASRVSVKFGVSASGQLHCAVILLAVKSQE
jgi:hypothetical protein